MNWICTEFTLSTKCYYSILACFSNTPANFIQPSLADVPGKPDVPNVTGVDRTHVALSWSPPESDGGSPITGYLIEKKDVSSTRWMKIKETIVDAEFTVRDLSEGQTYEFRVAAINKAGAGPFSEPTEPTLCKAPYGRLF